MRRTIIHLTLASLVALFSAAAGRTQAAPPTLTGEHLVDLNFTTLRITKTCNPNGVSTFQFTVSGPAVGPYPGTFTETGIVQIGPQTNPASPIYPSFATGPILSFNATFSIDSPAGNVTGTKEYRVDPAGGDFGICTSFSDKDIPEFGVVDADGFLSFIAVYNLRYEATIVTPAGTYTDEGRSTSTVGDFSVRAGTIGFGGNDFVEDFFSEAPPPPVVTATVLTPPLATNVVGTSHTVTATVTAGTTPVAGIDVLFTVTGSVNTTGSCTTDAQGQCSFTYSGPAFPGTDLITGCADANANGTADPDEHCGEAVKIWELPATTPGQVTGGGWILDVPPTSGVSFGFNAQADELGGEARGNCNLIDHASKTHIKCLTVDSLVVSPTHATFFGRAVVDGDETDYRIDVDDLGEPGTLDTFKIVTDGGYTAAGTLAGGNIQIHR